MSAREVVITHAVRTPIGKFLGTLAPLSAVELGTHAVSALMSKAKLEGDEVDEVLIGQARQLGSGPNPARQVTIHAGVSQACPAMTMNRACGSGLQSIWTARQSILLGEADIVVAGGMESMTNMPFLLPKMRFGYRLGHAKLLDGSYSDGFECRLANVPMGMTAEYLAEEFEISRDEQDAYALRSFERWEAAEDAGRFDDERVAIELTDRKGNVSSFAHDEHGRRGLTLEKIGKLPPVFKSDGTVHAGNSSGITDGAAAVLVTTREIAAQRGWPVLATISAGKLAGVEPERMGIGPVPAINELCASLDKKIDDFDLVELNEAFAAQVIACDREISFPADRLNVNGGAIALGHPIGCTGARIVVTLLHEMQRRDAKLGMATLCMSGGMGMAVAFER